MITEARNFELLTLSTRPQNRSVHEERTRTRAPLLSGRKYDYLNLDINKF